ncbi:hypothetical protein JJJ17_07755 [Paracoccus caeni]|uniref:Uncharacterized protein n=1 Tax=Paracoccus caeni TaxID=657651 RepID=A0A934SEC4_9RHOB|nr:hypothetical protein [Paracoccus caeni]MBK4215815.1 hypothetical protein [Paracoccus caeni]
MDLIIQADARNSVGFSMPFAGFEYLNFFTAGQMGRNLVPGAVQPSIVGAPDQEPGYISCTGQVDFVDTAVLETGVAMTLVTVSRLRGAQNSMFLGNYSGSSPGNPGLSLYGVASSNLVKGGAAGTAIVGPTVAGAADGWAFRALRVDNADVRVDDLTNETTDSVAIPGGTRVMNTHATLKIGSSHTSFPGQCDIAAAAIIRRRISDTELAALYQRMKVSAGMDGISI